MRFSRNYMQSRTPWMVLLVFLIVGLVVILSTRQNDPSSSIPTSDIKFLHQKQLLSATDLLKTDWIVALQKILTSRFSHSTERFLITVFCSKSYYNVLVNWMAALCANTNFDVADVLIIVTDEVLYLGLQTRKLSVLYVRKESVIREPERYKIVHQILMIRCAVVRLLNHWGYDVAMVDLDAIVLRDPHTLFQAYPDAQIVGSRGTHPQKLSEQWGLTLCMGFVLFKSSPATELFWNKASGVDNDTIDDQVKINYALGTLNIEWFTENNCSHISECVVYGRAKRGVNVVLLPEQVVCRHCSRLSPQTELVVWHQLVEKVGETKEKVAKKRNMWYLKPSWRRISSGSSLIGAEWMQQITRTSITHNQNF